MTSGGLYKPMGINSYSSNKPINSLGYNTKSSDLPSIGKEKSPFKGTYKSFNAYIYPSRWNNRNVGGAKSPYFAKPTSAMTPLRPTPLTTTLADKRSSNLKSADGYTGSSSIKPAHNGRVSGGRGSRPPVSPNAFDNTDNSAEVDYGDEVNATDNTPIAKRLPLIGISSNEMGALQTKTSNIPKPPEVREIISKAFHEHFLFAKIGKDMENALIDSMERVEVPKGTIIIKEGDNGDNCYVIQSGKFSCFEKAKGNSLVNQMGPGILFGDLALIYNCPRSATVQASVPSVVWRLDRQVFRTVLAMLSTQELTQTKELLKGVPQLKALTEDQLTSVIQVITTKTYNTEEVILNRQDDSTIALYVVQSGTAMIRYDDGKSKDVVKGEYFGAEVLGNKKPQYSVIAKEKTTCVCLNTHDFTRVAGNLQEIIEHNQRVKALRSIAILQYLTESELEQLDEAFVEETYKDSYIIKQGENGDQFFILKEGKCRVTVNVTRDGRPYEEEKCILKADEGAYFGELALLSQDKRSANVIALGEVTCFVLDRHSFIKLLGPLRDIMNQHSVMRVLKRIPLFRNLSQKELESMAQAFTSRRYQPGEYVITEGTPAKEFFIISEGTVTITKTNNGQTVTLGHSGVGDHLGEVGLITNELRTANAIADTTVDVFILGSDEFQKLCAPILEKLQEQCKQIKLSDQEALKTTSPVDKYKDLKLSDLDTIALLGTGVLGRVTLVRCRKLNEVFALKAMYKAVIVDKKQQSAVTYEKNILLQLDHPFILRLIRTFKDRERIYMMTEYINGGELYGFLRRCPKHRIRSTKARFYAASVILVLEYIHSKRIVHRDLKPENVLIDSEGFIKMIDFGFAKEIRDKTYTLCGTPEYLSPEVILGRGYNRSCDIWAVGILIYEMLCGNAPFRAQQEDRLFQKITEGKLEFPPKFADLGAKDLIEKILVVDVNHRMGCLKRGIRDIKDHVWFNGLDWKALLRRRIEVPWVPTIRNEFDHSNFGCNDPDEPPPPYKDDGSGWDSTF